MKDQAQALHKEIKRTLLLCKSLALCLYLSPSFVLAQSLEKTVAIAFNTNPELKAIYHKYRATEQNVNTAKSGWFPVVSANGSMGVGKQDVPESRVGTQDTDVEPISLGLSIDQLLFDGFYTSNDIERAEHETLSEFYKLKSQAENTTLEIVTAYLSLLEQQQLKELAKRNLASHEDIYQQIKIRTDSGLGSTSELSQARGRLAKANANVLTAINNYQDAVAAYIRLVGGKPSKLVMPVADNNMLPISKGLVLDNAVNNHPIIKSASADLMAAKSAMSANQASYFPRVSFELSQDYSDDSDNSNVRRDELRAQVKMTYNLFRGGADRAKEIQSAYSIEQAKEIKKSAQRQVLEGAEFSWNAHHFTEKQLTFLKQHVEQSFLTQQAYKKQFNLGRRTLLDLLDTENELFEARRDYVSAESKYYLSKYRVLNSIGGLLKSLRINIKQYWSETKRIE